MRLGERDRSLHTGDKEAGMATRERRYGPAGGITLGGIIVVIGIVLMFVWSFWIGLIIALVGLIFFGGFARGRWY
jgi:4-hydroxybenzoate polyprenyltransferase